MQFHLNLSFKADYVAAKEKEQAARELYFRKKALDKDATLPKIPLDAKFKPKDTVNTLKAKWQLRTKNRDVCKKTLNQRAQDLLEFKKERNVFTRKEGEVWKCGEGYKMEWTHSPL